MSDPVAWDFLSVFFIIINYSAENICPGTNKAVSSQRQQNKSQSRATQIGKKLRRVVLFEIN